MNKRPAESILARLFLFIVAVGPCSRLRLFKSAKHFYIYFYFLVFQIPIYASQVWDMLQICSLSRLETYAVGVGRIICWGVLLWQVIFVGLQILGTTSGVSRGMM